MSSEPIPGARGWPREVHDCGTTLPLVRRDDALACPGCDARLGPLDDEQQPPLPDDPFALDALRARRAVDDGCLVGRLGDELDRPVAMARVVPRGRRWVSTIVGAPAIVIGFLFLSGLALGALAQVARWASERGWEHVAFMAVAALAVAFTGPLTKALDRAWLRVTRPPATVTLHDARDGRLLLRLRQGPRRPLFGTAAHDVLGPDGSFLGRLVAGSPSTRELAREPSSRDDAHASRGMRAPRAERRLRARGVKRSGWSARAARGFFGPTVPPWALVTPDGRLITGADLSSTAPRADGVTWTGAGSASIDLEGVPSQDRPFVVALTLLFLLGEADRALLA